MHADHGDHRTPAVDVSGHVKLDARSDRVRNNPVALVLFCTTFAFTALPIGAGGGARVMALRYTGSPG